MRQHPTKRALFPIRALSWSISKVGHLLLSPSNARIYIYIYILIRSTREEPIVSPREQCSFETFELLKTDGWLCLVCTTTAKFFISPDRNFVFFSFLLLSSLRFNLRRLVTTRRVTTTNDFPPFLFVFNDRRVEFSSSFRESLEFWYSSSFVYPKKLWDSENCSIKFLIPAQKSNRVRY